MKKLISVLALVMLLSPLSAAAFSYLGFSLGGTMKNSSFTLGVTSTAMFTGDVNRNFGIGLSTHFDGAMMFSDEKRLPGQFAVIVGPGFEFRPTEYSSINLTIGPAVMLEDYDSFSVGAGIDASYTWYFSMDKEIGVTFGTTLYPQFYVDDSSRNTPFSFAGSAYIGISWRRITYSWDPLGYAPLGFVIY